MPFKKPIVPIRITRQGLKLLDQRRLPLVERYVTCGGAGDVALAIKRMVVRGAPAIGVAAAHGYALSAERSRARTREALLAELHRHAGRLRSARPTAVNLAWAVDRMQRAAEGTLGGPAAIARALRAEAEAIHEEDLRANRSIGLRGQELLPDRATVLTHCNAGALATAGYGTALGVIRAAAAAGKHIRVIADETRPILQGARLTAWELLHDGIEVTLVADAAAGHLMARGFVHAVIVGADRITMNGDVANKIGTYSLACLAKRHGIPFYVAAPVSTIDPTRRRGEEIPIEERLEEEILSVLGRRTAPRGARAYNPAFDVTPSELISAIITDRGILRPPFERALAGLFPSIECSS